jgi:hypothetical protein
MPLTLAVDAFRNDTLAPLKNFEQGEARTGSDPKGTCMVLPNITYNATTSSLNLRPGSTSRMEQVWRGSIRNMIALPIVQQYGIPILSAYNASIAAWFGHNLQDCKLLSAFNFASAGEQ